MSGNLSLTLAKSCPTASPITVNFHSRASPRWWSASNWLSRPSSQLLGLLGCIDHLGEQEDVTLHRQAELQPAPMV